MIHSLRPANSCQSRRRDDGAKAGDEGDDDEDGGKSFVVVVVAHCCCLCFGSNSFHFRLGPKMTAEWGCCALRGGDRVYACVPAR